jgi:tRNA nucleotidyltransferase (CCA-adding enzyme)
LNDLRRRHVRVLHSLSFVDDPTRLLRAVRFEQRFNFQIEDRTLQLMAEAMPLLRQVSADRIRHELDLILQEDHPVLALQRLQSLNLLKAIDPDLSWNSSYEAPLEKALKLPADPLWNLPGKIGHTPLSLALAYLVWLMPLSPVQAVCAAARLRLPGIIQSALQAGANLYHNLQKLENLPASQITQILDNIPLAALYALTLLDIPEPYINVLRNYATAWRNIKPGIDGNDLQSRGVPVGPIYRFFLENLRAAWIDGKIHNQVEEEEFLLSLMKETPLSK